MIAIPTKTNLRQVEDKYAVIVSRLDAIASELEDDEVWDEARIQTIAGLRYIYKDHVGTNKKAVDEYFEMCSGHILHYLEEQSVDALDDAKVWFAIEDDLCGDAWHWYQGMMSEYESFTHYLPEDWTFTTNLMWPQKGEELLETLDNYTTGEDVEQLVEADVLGDDRELCGRALVKTGYLTNQENLRTDDLTVLQAYKSFTAVLDKALEEYGRA